VKEIFTRDIDHCLFECRIDSACKFFSIYKFQYLKNATSNGKHQFGKANKWNYICYLENFEIGRMVQMHSLHFSNFYDIILVSHGIKPSIGKPDPEINSLLKGPVAFDPSTMILFNQNLYRGCSYSVSLWVWLFKPRDAVPTYDEITIFTSRETFPRLHPDKAAILPAVVYNVGRYPDRIFFSAARDEYGYYLGFWAPFEVRYHEWIHITLVIENNILKGYINGEFMDYVAIYPSKTNLHCPYEITIPQEFIELQGLNHYEDAISPPFLTNNTVLQIGNKWTNNKSYLLFHYDTFQG
jgi:hypothetical protein